MATPAAAAGGCGVFVVELPGAGVLGWALGWLARWVSRGVKERGTRWGCERTRNVRGMKNYGGNSMRFSQLCS